MKALKQLISITNSLNWLAWLKPLVFLPIILKVNSWQLAPAENIDSLSCLKILLSLIVTQNTGENFFAVFSPSL